MAAVVYSLGKEAQGLVAIAENTLSSKWYTKYANGDPTVVLEVESALAEKSERFTVRDIKILSDLWTNTLGHRRAPLARSSRCS